MQQIDRTRTCIICFADLQRHELLVCACGFSLILFLSTFVISMSKLKVASSVAFCILDFHFLIFSFIMLTSKGIGACPSVWQPEVLDLIHSKNLAGCCNASGTVFLSKEV